MMMKRTTNKKKNFTVRELFDMTSEIPREYRNINVRNIRGNLLNAMRKYEDGADREIACSDLVKKPLIPVRPK